MGCSENPRGEERKFIVGGGFRVLCRTVRGSRLKNGKRILREYLVTWQESQRVKRQDSLREKTKKKKRDHKECSLVSLVILEAGVVSQMAGERASETGKVWISKSPFSSSLQLNLLLCYSQNQSTTVHLSALPSYRLRSEDKNFFDKPLKLFLYYISY